MIFRRVKAHIEKENWFAVFIDFLIVVVGVFIGIQVANWNASSQQESTTQHYIERISNDLLASQDDIKQRLSYFNQTRNHALSALEALELDKTKLGSDFLIDIYQASQMLPREIGRDSYDEVLSIGANTAIPDVNVRKRIGAYYRSISALDKNLLDVMPYRDIVRRNMPYTVQAAIRKACNEVATTNQSGEAVIMLPTKCEPDLNEIQISKAVNAILELDIEKDLTRQLSNLDLKINAGELLNNRSLALYDYLQGLQP